MKKIISCLLAALGLTTACGQQNYANTDVQGFAELISALHDGHTNDVFVCSDKDIFKVQSGEPIYTPKEIFVVTDERTFSAAFHFAYMMNKMGATIVGVPSGQSPNTFMELTPFRLPNSGLECSVSNSLQLCYPQGHPKAHVFTPDIQLTYQDYQKYNFSKDAELLYLMDYPGTTTDIQYLNDL